MRRVLLAAASLATAVIFAPSPASAQMAASQLCSAAGYGGGCIGAFRPSGGMGGGGGGMGNAFGGMMMSIGIGLLMDAVMDSMAETEAAEQAAQQQAALQQQQQQQRAMAERARRLQQEVEAQRAFEAEQNRQLMSAMLDAPANQMIDSTGDMKLLEQDAYAASKPFDIGQAATPGVLWTPYDKWFSPETMIGITRFAEPVSDTRVSFGPENATAPKCMANGLCAFEQSNVRTAIVHVPAPAGPAPAVRLPDAALSKPVPQLGTGAPDVPIRSQFTLPAAPQATEAPCAEHETFDLKNTFVGALKRNIWNDPAHPAVGGAGAAREAGGRLAEDPMNGVDVISTWFVSMTENLPNPTMKVATGTTNFYRRMFEKLSCGVFGMMADAVVDPDRALAKAENTQGMVADAFRDAAPALPGGEAIRFTMTWQMFSPGEAVRDTAGRLYEQAKDRLREKAEEARDEAIDRAEDAVLDPLKEHLKKGVEKHIVKRIPGDKLLAQDIAALERIRWSWLRLPPGKS